jgi:2,5-diketo-D-gluconate reductase B
MTTIEIRGTRVPRIGLGTWALSGGTCQESVLAALELGYRHIDTAEMYGNEADIGQALARSGIDRSQLFLVSKVWRNHMRYSEVMSACDRSLSDLRTDYLDLYLIHWPVYDVPVEETVRALDELQRSGRAHHIGVSNFSVGQLREAQEASQSGIFCNQVRFNPWANPADVLSACQDSGVLVTAYTPLAHGSVVGSDVLREIGIRHGKTAAQVALRWLIEHRNVVAIPKASSREHLAENMAVFDFELTEDEAQAIERLAD